MLFGPESVDLRYLIRGTDFIFKHNFENELI